MSGPRCHVCGRPLDRLWATATDTEYVTTTERFSYFHCPSCDCLSIDPLPAERLSEIYPPNYYSFASGRDAQTSRSGHPVTRIKAALDARVFRGVLDLVAADAPRILDVGGGTGELAAGLLDSAPQGARGTVVDFDADSIEAARARGLSGFVGPFEEYETDERFDIVLMLNLIEHVADPAAMLEKARGLLAPGGIVWLQTPNFRSLDSRIFRRLNWAGLHCPRHWVIFSRDGLERILVRSRLEPLSLRYTQGGAFWAGSVLGLRRAVRGLEEGRPLKPIVQIPGFLPLAGAGAGFDLLTRRLRPTSQVVAVARATP